MKYSLQYKISSSLKKIGLSPQIKDVPQVQDMINTIRDLGPEGLRFSISILPNGEWVAESTNLPGVITGGTSKDDMSEMIKDSVFTYFGVPPQYCSNQLLRASGESQVIKQGLHLAIAGA